MRKQALKIPVTKDVCFFCLARMQFALRRPQRRMLSSSHAHHRPPATGIAQKEDDREQDPDSTWGSQPPRPFGGGWARNRTAEPSDLTPEEMALRNALMKEPTSKLPSLKTESPQAGQSGTTQRPIFRRIGGLVDLGNEKESRLNSMNRQDGQIGTTQESRVRKSPRYQEYGLEQSLSLQDGRLPNYPPAHKPQVASIGRSLDENNGPRKLRDGATAQAIPASESHTPQRPTFGGWAKNDRATELNVDEEALRQALQKGAAPRPHAPGHSISHPPQLSSVPGFPSRLDPQTEDARLEEIARTSPVQASSIRRQRTQETTNDPNLSKSRQARDAQLDYYISRARVASQFSPGVWYCPSCAQQYEFITNFCDTCQSKRPHLSAVQCRNCRRENSPFRSHCIRCRTPLSNTIYQATSENAMGWKHIRRVGPNVAPEHLQADVVSTQRHLDDTERFARARAIKQETMERMEKTKGGEFIGLRSQHETATSKAMKDSYWSQVPHAEPFSSGMSDKSTTGVGLVDQQAHSAESPQVREMQDFRHKTSAQQAMDKPLEDGRRTSKLAFDESVPSSSLELEHEQNAREYKVRTRERDDPTIREPQKRGIAKQLLYDRPPPSPWGNNRNRIRNSKKKFTTYDQEDEEYDNPAARRIERKEQRKKTKALEKAAAPPTPIYLPEYISLSNLAGVLRVRVEDFIRKMKDLGFQETNNDLILDAETAGLVAAEFHFEPIFEQAENPDLLPRPPAENKSVLPPRPPVVTIMGHVDHGKTTLLDYLRKSSVAASEHGGITQHIGAFSVPMPGGRLVTFLDTPGHEAFLSMRQRGANVTDIVILVVAADDSVKPQTIEAIRHAQAAKVPMIVAINKIDKGDSNAERVKQDLARYGVEVEDYGGDTQAVCVSGKTGQGMEELEDAAVALADILDMRSETDGQVEGWVLEATTKKAGRVATVLVRRGTLRPGDIIVAGTSWARIRSLRNEAGVMLKSAGPGSPVEIDGWREQPAAGDEVLQAPDEQRAKAVVNYRLEAHERTQMATDIAAVNEARRLEQEKREELARAADLAENASDDDAAIGGEEQSTSPTPSFHEVFLIIKADVSGSVEAVTNAISALGNSEVRPNILRTGVGPVTEFDVDLATAAKGHIISFNTTVDGNIQRIADIKEVMIINQSIIYRLVDDVKARLSEKLSDIVTQKVLGEAEIAQVFEINTKGRVTVPIAGCRVKNGVIGRNNKVRVLRGKETVYDGKFSSLKNVKKDVTEMRKGTECGIGFQDWTAFKPGDQVQCYEEMFKKRTLG